MIWDLAPKVHELRDREDGSQPRPEANTEASTFSPGGAWWGSGGCGWEHPPCG